MDEIRDSHYVVAYLMTTMNYISAIELNKLGTLDVSINKNIGAAICKKWKL